MSHMFEIAYLSLGKKEEGDGAFLNLIQFYLRCRFWVASREFGCQGRPEGHG
jgi:hypothetical protein